MHTDPLLTAWWDKEVLVPQGQAQGALFLDNVLPAGHWTLRATCPSCRCSRSFSSPGLSKQMVTYSEHFQWWHILNIFMCCLRIGWRASQLNRKEVQGGWIGKNGLLLRPTVCNNITTTNNYVWCLASLDDQFPTWGQCRKKTQLLLVFLLPLLQGIRDWHGTILPQQYLIQIQSGPRVLFWDCDHIYRPALSPSPKVWD